MAKKKFTAFTRFSRNSGNVVSDVPSESASLLNFFNILQKCCNVESAVFSLWLNLSQSFKAFKAEVKDKFNMTAGLMQQLTNILKSGEKACKFNWFYDVIFLLPVSCLGFGGEVNVTPKDLGVSFLNPKAEKKIIFFLEDVLESTFLHECLLFNLQEEEGLCIDYRYITLMEKRLQAQRRAGRRELETNFHAMIKLIEMVNLSKKKEKQEEVNNNWEHILKFYENPVLSAEEKEKARISFKEQKEKQKSEVLKKYNGAVLKNNLKKSGVIKALSSAIFERLVGAQKKKGSNQAFMAKCSIRYKKVLIKRFIKKKKIKKMQRVVLKKSKALFLFKGKYGVCFWQLERRQQCYMFKKSSYKFLQSLRKLNRLTYSLMGVVGRGMSFAVWRRNYLRDGLGQLKKRIRKNAKTARSLAAKLEYRKNKMERRKKISTSISIRQNIVKRKKKKVYTKQVYAKNKNFKRRKVINKVMTRMGERGQVILHMPHKSKTIYRKKNALYKVIALVSTAINKRILQQQSKNIRQKKPFGPYKVKGLKPLAKGGILREGKSRKL